MSSQFPVVGLIHGFGFAADLLALQLPPERRAERLAGWGVFWFVSRSYG